MNKMLRFVFYFLLFFFVLHTIRDVLQILNIRGNILTDLFSTKHFWCGGYCDFVTLLPEIFGIVGSIIILNRKKSGILGIFVILAFISIQIGFILP